MSVVEISPGKALSKIPAGRFVRVEDLPGSRGAASSALSRARRNGELVSVRKGLYFKGVRTRYGMTRPLPEEVAVEVLGTAGVGPSGFSAARALGLTSQIPAVPTLTVAGPVPSAVVGVRVSKRNNMGRRRLRYVEVAVLELLRGDWKVTVDGGWSAFVAAVGDAVRGSRVRLPALTEAVKTERSPEARDTLVRLTEALTVREF